MNQIVKRTATWFCLASVAPAFATTLVVDAPVVDVERLEIATSPADQCVPARHTLARFLASDLCPDEPVDQAVDQAVEYRYRVTYLWDDRSYERVVDQAPGTTIPVRLELE